MPKTIKFNLTLDGNPVRDIEGLQNNFCIDDVLTVYENGLLEKWLNVRKFDDYLKKVKKIKKEEGVIKQLIKIFDIEKSEKEIMEGIYSLTFWEERKAQITEWETKDNNVKQIVEKYHFGYRELKEKILEHKFDMPFLKELTKQIYDTYFEIFEIDYKYFFNEFVDSVPFVIFSILMNNDLRKIFLSDKDIYAILSLKMVYNENTLTNLYLSFIDSDIKMRTQLVGTGEILSDGLEVIDNYEPIIEISVDGNVNHSVWRENRKLSFTNEVKYIRLNDINNSMSLSYFSGKTDNYWKDLEPKCKKFMIISMQEGNFVRNSAKQGEELSASDVNGKFPILKGIDYKSNNPAQILIYIEV